MTSEMMPCSLSDCPPGLFWFNGMLGMKTEYRTESVSRPGCLQCDAYVVASGEYFWGGVSDPREREKLMVTPIDNEAALAALATRPPAPATDLARLAELLDDLERMSYSAGFENATDDHPDPVTATAHQKRARAAVDTALSALQAEVREVTIVLDRICDEILTSDQVILPDDFTVTVELTLGDLRRASALHEKMEG